MRNRRHPLPRRVVTLVVALCALEGTALGQSSVLPEPDSPGSHEAYLSALGNAEAEEFNDLLSRYDDRIKMEPDSVVAAVERCAFIEGSVDFESDSLVRADLADACSEDLEERFPAAAEAVLYVLERSWGDEGVQRAEQALADLAPHWTAKDRGRARLELARMLAATNPKRAAEEAALAMQEAPDLDGSMLVAEHLIQQSRSEEAVAVLNERLGASGEPYITVRKIRMLLDQGDALGAERGLQIVDAQGEDYVDNMLRGEVLEGLGRIDEARDIYQLLDEPYMRASALERLFEIELTSGTRDDAIATYQSLRDEGYDLDPFARSRIRLALAYPDAPWAWRDLLGILAFLAVLLGAFCVPALWSIPIHYAGLIRRVRGYELPSGARWTLKLAWFVAGAYIVVDLLCTHVFLPDHLTSIFLDFFYLPAPNTATLAAYGLTVSALGLASVAVFLRRRDSAVFLHSDWSVSETLFSVGGLFLLLLLLGGLNRGIALALGYEDQTLAFRDLFADLTNVQILHAIMRTHGSMTLLLVGALLGPLTEELIYRYALLDAFRRHITPAWANVTQATLFALAHDNLVMLPFFFVFGLVAGTLRMRSQSLIPSLLLHITWNLMVCLLFIALGRI